MSDQALRELERRWRGSTDPADEAAFLGARVRAGLVDLASMKLAAFLGHEPCRQLVGELAPVKVPRAGLFSRLFGGERPKPLGEAAAWLRAWSERLVEHGDPVALRAAIAAVRQAQPAWRAAARRDRAHHEARGETRPALAESFDDLERAAERAIEHASRRALAPDPPTARPHSAGSFGGVRATFRGPPPEAYSVFNDAHDLPDRLLAVGWPTADVRFGRACAQAAVDVILASLWWLAPSGGWRDFDPPADVADGLRAGIAAELLPWALGGHDPLRAS